MNDETLEFNRQLELDVLVNGLTEITEKYVKQTNPHLLTEVVIPEGVTSIGNQAFFDCLGIKHITIPNSVTSIGARTFCSCEYLQRVKIGNNVSRIGNGAFWNCHSLTRVTIPSSVTSIGEWAFEYCRSLTRITFKGKTMKEVRSMDGYPWHLSPGINPIINARVS